MTPNPPRFWRNLTGIGLNFEKATSNKGEVDHRGDDRAVTMPVGGVELG